MLGQWSLSQLPLSTEPAAPQPNLFGVSFCQTLAIGALTGVIAASGVAFSSSLAIGQELGTESDSGVSLVSTLAVGAMSGKGALSGAALISTLATGALSGVAPLSGVALSVTLTTGILSGVSTPVVVVQETPAGRPSRTRPTQYIIRIDSQEFICRTLEEALGLLQRAREAAALFSVQEAEKAAQRLSAAPIAGQLPKLEVPKIEVNSRDLRAAVSETKREIAKTYRKALIESEIRLLFELDRIEREEEENLFWLM